MFVPLLQTHRLGARGGGRDACPATQMIPAAVAVRSLLALKLMGKERKSHVMDSGLRRGHRAVRRSQLRAQALLPGAYSSRVDHRANSRLMDAWFGELEHSGFAHGASLDLDFHSVPANSAEEPLEKHYVSSRSRRQKGILVFLARDAEHAGAALRPRRHPQGQAGRRDPALRRVLEEATPASLPAELVFDSQLTTYGNLAQLNQQGIRFITLRRRSRKMLGGDLQPRRPRPGGASPCIR